MWPKAILRLIIFLMAPQVLAEGRELSMKIPHCMRLFAGLQGVDLSVLNRSPFRIEIVDTEIEAYEGKPERPTDAAPQLGVQSRKPSERLLNEIRAMNAPLELVQGLESGKDILFVGRLLGTPHVRNFFEEWTKYSKQFEKPSYFWSFVLTGMSSGLFVRDLVTYGSPGVLSSILVAASGFDLFVTYLRRSIAYPLTLTAHQSIQETETSPFGHWINKSALLSVEEVREEILPLLKREESEEWAARLENKTGLMRLEIDLLHTRNQVGHEVVDYVVRLK